jgi:hypothetical protein
MRLSVCEQCGESDLSEYFENVSFGVRKVNGPVVPGLVRWRIEDFHTTGEEHFVTLIDLRR